MNFVVKLSQELMYMYIKVYIIHDFYQYFYCNKILVARVDLLKLSSYCA